MMYSIIVTNPVLLEPLIKQDENCTQKGGACVVIASKVQVMECFGKVGIDFKILAQFI
jgi:hypothetical protein